MRTTKHRLAAALLALALTGVLGTWAAATETGLEFSAQSPPEVMRANPTQQPAPDPTPPPKEDTEPDKNFIVVHKHFVGLPPMDKLPDNFTITLKNEDGTQTYVLTADGVNGQTPLPVKEADGITWSWRVHIPDGDHTYSVSESGYEIEDYTVTTKAPASVSTTMTTSTVEWLGGKDPVQVNDKTNEETLKGCNLLWFETAGGYKPKSVVIWTLKELSASERNAMVKKINSFAPNTADRATLFFHGNMIKDDALYVKDGYIKYDYESGILTINAPQFSVVYSGEYFIENTADGDGAEVVIYNTYTRLSVDVTVSKTVKGEYGDTTESFDFTMTLDGGVLTPGTYTDENGIAYTVAGDGTTVTFSLTHGQSILIPLPQGCKVTVSENSNGYDTTVNKVIGTSATIESLGAGGATFDFVNELPYSPDTGITLDALPYVLILIGVGAAAAVLLLRKRRRDDGEEW